MDADWRVNAVVKAFLKVQKEFKADFDDLFSEAGLGVVDFDDVASAILEEADDGEYTLRDVDRVADMMECEGVLGASYRTEGVYDIVTVNGYTLLGRATMTFVSRLVAVNDGREADRPTGCQLYGYVRCTRCGSVVTHEGGRICHHLKLLLDTAIYSLARKGSRRFSTPLPVQALSLKLTNYKKAVKVGEAEVRTYTTKLGEVTLCMSCLAQECPHVKLWREKNAV